MSALKKEMIRKAMRRYGWISLCGGKENWDQCFSEWDSRLVFWFNSRDGSTRVVAAEQGARRQD